MDYWHKQAPGQPLFPDLVWARPENRQAAGKLGIIGGNAYGFAAVAEAYNQAVQAGIGTARVLLPDSVQKIVGLVLPEGEFAPSNPSGSFAKAALAGLLDLAGWSDGVLLAGDLGRNSETAITLESFITKHSGLAVLTKDAFDYFATHPAVLIDRPQTVAVISLAQLQKLFSASGQPRAITFSMDLSQLVGALHDFTKRHNLELIVRQGPNFVVAAGGKVSTTTNAKAPEVWRVAYAGRAAVWRLQNPSQPFEALTVSIVQ